MSSDMEGMETGCSPFTLRGVGERPGHQMRGKGSVIFHPGETVVQDGWPRLRPLITEGGRCVSRLGEDRHFLVLVV